MVISVGGAKAAAEYAVPAVRVLVADTWKKMDVEIEWGYEQETAEKDYSGRIEAYDGMVAGLAPLDGDTVTTATEAGFVAFGRQRRRAPWSEGQPPVHGHVEVAAECSPSRLSRTTWREPSSRCGPRPATSLSWQATWRTGQSWRPSTGSSCGGRRSCRPRAAKATRDLRPPRIPLGDKMRSIAGSEDLLGWGSDARRGLAAIRLTRRSTVLGITIPGPESGHASGSRHATWPWVGAAP